MDLLLRRAGCIYPVRFHIDRGDVYKRQAIRRIAENGGLAAMPEELKELARLRCEFPEYSLRELGARLTPPISRSGVNHRLKKILQIAEEMDEPGR